MYVHASDKIQDSGGRHFKVQFRAYFNVPTGTDVLGDLKSVLENLVTRA